MSLFEQFKSRPVVVQRLTFVWGLLALYPVATLLSYTVYLAGVSAPNLQGVPLAVLLPLALGWGHFRQAKVVWWLGVFLSVPGTILGVCCIPFIYRIINLTMQNQRHLNTSAFTPAQRARLGGTTDPLLHMAVINMCILVTSLLLLAAACVLALSRSGRAAYGIGRQSA